MLWLTIYQKRFFKRINVNIFKCFQIGYFYQNRVVIIKHFFEEKSEQFKLKSVKR